MSGEYDYEKILKALTTKHGKPMHVDSLAADTGLSNAQVSRGVHAARAKGFQVLSPKKGWYLYQGDGKSSPVSTPTPTIMDIIGKAKSGAWITRDEHGTLYLASPLDV